MAEIELIIKIDEEDYEMMKHNIAVNNPLCPLSQEEMVSKVANGVVIPKGHGRIVDENKISKFEQIGLIMIDGNVTPCFTTNAPTILDRVKGYKNRKADK